jgi:predicted lipoprotein with Yx(FWY)xxD motif
MRTPIPLILCAALATLVACQREATSPEMGNAPAREKVTDPADVAPATAPAAPAATTPGGDAVLTLVTAGVPQPFVADASSRTLYYVEGDMDGSKCTGPCLETWPPLLVETGTPVTSGALTGAVATIERAGGGRQVTYNGHPLYRYAGDAGVGRIAGHGVEDKWGHWYGLAADGSPLPEAPGMAKDANAAKADTGTDGPPEKSPAPPTPPP